MSPPGFPSEHAGGLLRVPPYQFVSVIERATETDGAEDFIRASSRRAVLRGVKPASWLGPLSCTGGLALHTPQLRQKLVCIENLINCSSESTRAAARDTDKHQNKDRRQRGIHVAPPDTRQGIINSRGTARHLCQTPDSLSPCLPAASPTPADHPLRNRPPRVGRALQLHRACASA